MLRKQAQAPGAEAEDPVPLARALAHLVLGQAAPLPAVGPGGAGPHGLRPPPGPRRVRPPSEGVRREVDRDRDGRPASLVQLAGGHAHQPGCVVVAAEQPHDQRLQELGQALVVGLHGRALLPELLAGGGDADPGLPVQAVVVRGHEAGPAAGAPGQALEVQGPPGAGRQPLVVGVPEHHLHAVPVDEAEDALGVHEEPLVVAVDPRSGAEELLDGLCGHADHEGDEGRVHQQPRRAVAATGQAREPAAASLQPRPAQRRLARCLARLLHGPFGVQPAEHAVVQERDAGQGSYEVDPRVVPRADDPHLEANLQQARENAAGTDGDQHEERQNKLLHERQRHLHAMKALRHVVHVPRQRVGHRLGEVVRLRARELPPACARVPAHLGHARAEEEAEGAPSDEPEHKAWRRRPAPKSTRVQGTEEDREEAHLAREPLPAVTVGERRLEVHDGQIQHPAGRRHEGRPQAADQELQGQGGAEPAHELQLPVPEAPAQVLQEFEGGRGAAAGTPGPSGEGGQAQRAPERPVLQRGDEEAAEVAEAHAAQQRFPSEPVRVAEVGLCGGPPLPPQLPDPGVVAEEQCHGRGHAGGDACQHRCSVQPVAHGETLCLHDGCGDLRP
mmetsp:Transcript_29555/g.92233  ORF Transcript_29555/g.92233 Transcript_29555/m.92233 type:complete len:617 (-) Transcript_29555:219-2069(-)